MSPFHVIPELLSSLVFAILTGLSLTLLDRLWPINMSLYFMVDSLLPDFAPSLLLEQALDCPEDFLICPANDYFALFLAFHYDFFAIVCVRVDEYIMRPPLVL